MFFTHAHIRQNKIALTSPIMITTSTLRLILFCHLFIASTCRRIAVIGGGISGTFVSKYLAEYDKDCSILEIAIFDPLPLGEPTTEISGPDWQGSRVASVRMEDGGVVEIGASVFYSGFYLVMEMVTADPTLKIGRAFNNGSSTELDPGLRDGMGIYNGNGDWKFLAAKSSVWWFFTKMAWRYNIDLYRAFSAVSKAQRSFEVMNHLLHSEHETTFFENPADLWDSVGLLNAAHNSYDAFLDALAVCKSFNTLPWWRRLLPYQGCLREELLAAVTLVNYNQGTSQANGLVGLGSFVATKVNLVSLVGGNQQMIASAYRQAQSLSESTCHKQGIIKHVQQRITTVVASLEHMELFSHDISLGQYDVVILAAPLPMSRVDFLVQSQKDASVLTPMPFDMINVEDHKPNDDEHPAMPRPLPDFATRPYTQVVTTLVSGAELNSTYFHLDPDGLPRGIYMTEHGKAQEHSITAIAQMTTVSGVYKIFSSKELGDELLKVMFGESHKVEVVKIWGGPNGGATPDYQGAGWTINYLLYDAGNGIKGHSHGAALYYTNAIETSMACMELSAIGAKSVAKLVAKRLGLVVPHNGTKVQSDEL